MTVATTDSTPLLKLQGVTKHFGGVTALENVDFDLRAGEIHALLGENGAGKSTLIKILGGIHAPDRGRITLGGEEATIRSVAEADRLGIRLIHQELSLAPNLSVAENIYLGREETRWGWLQRGGIFAAAERLVASLGLDEIRNVRALVAELSVAHQQLVEIARALSCQARILVLDEPTSALSEAETEALFATLRRLRTQGVGMIYISHRLEEILRLADRITVLRDGHSIGTQATGAVDQGKLVRWMVGREIVDHFRRPRRGAGGMALEVRGLCNEHIHDVSFSVRHGEVLGIAGLVGSGRSELVRAVFGIDRLDRGEILVNGKAVTIRRPRQALDAGVVLVPEDRKSQGLVMTHSTGFNLALPWVRQWIRGCFPDGQQRTDIIGRAITNFAIKVAEPELSIDRLSGGNQQKALVGRWLEHRPEVLILDEPTRGVDVGAREEMFRILSRLAESGMAVVLISSDLAEVLHMSHRIALYRDGRILEIAAAEQLTMERIMHRLTGAQVHAAV
jgi:ABC-type sugar transport system ATPase subunit